MNYSRDYNSNSQWGYSDYEDQFDGGYIAAPHNTYSVTEEPEVEVKKKKRTGLKIMALCLAMLILGGLGTYAGISLYTELYPPAVSTDGGDYDDPLFEDKAAPGDRGSEDVTSTDALKTFSAASSSMTASEIYKAYSSSVVAIKTESTYANIFGQTSTYASSGTGFIITEDGYILTNNHVVSGANTVTVSLESGESYTAAVIGADETSDIAVLHIDASGLCAVNLGDSDNIIVGEDIVAVGNPLGELTNTLTRGVVSALNRLINIDGTPINMFQIDAAVNSGNSGGPVFDSTGRVIGIVTAKYSDSSVEGLGFAIPINDALTVAQSIMKYGYVTGRASLGVMVRTLDAASAAYYGVPQGAYVSSVVSGGSAEKAGIQAGDIITRLGNTSVTSRNDLEAAKLKFSAGDTAEIDVYRSGDTLTLTIRFDEENANSGTVQTEPNNTYPGGGEFPFSGF